MLIAKTVTSASTAHPVGVGISVSNRLPRPVGIPSQIYALQWSGKLQISGSRMCTFTNMEI